MPAFSSGLPASKKQFLPAMSRQCAACSGPCIQTQTFIALWRRSLSHMPAQAPHCLLSLPFCLWENSVAGTNLCFHAVPPTYYGSCMLLSTVRRGGMRRKEEKRNRHLWAFPGVLTPPFPPPHTPLPLPPPPREELSKIGRLLGDTFSLSPTLHFWDWMLFCCMLGHFVPSLGILLRRQGMAGCHAMPILEGEADMPGSTSIAFCMLTAALKPNSLLSFSSGSPCLPQCVMTLFPFFSP